MKYPKFFDNVESIELVDSLGGFLGAFDDGRVNISYIDCVKLAGHSCPTVASAFMMAKLGLEALYPDQTPQRSEITVTMKENKESGVTGVIANVVSYIVGAGDSGGFKGIGDRFGRNDLLIFDEETQTSAIKLTRQDNGTSVYMSCDTSKIPGSPEMMPLMQKCLAQQASDQEFTEFRKLWQGRVEQLLTQKSVQNSAITITT